MSRFEDYVKIKWKHWTGQAYSREFTHNSDGTNPLPQYASLWRDVSEGSLNDTGFVTTNGIMQLRLREKLMVEMTVDQAVRVTNKKSNTVLALNESGSAAALLHSNGRVYQYGSRVEILAHDLQKGNHKFAKMCRMEIYLAVLPPGGTKVFLIPYKSPRYKGVSFTSEESALVFLVDSAGTRTATDTFTDMTEDFSLSVFYSTSRYGPSCIPEAIELLKKTEYWIKDDGTENWIINNLRISQSVDGLLRVARASQKYMLRTSPSNGTASLSTPFIHTTASLGSTSHLFVRRGERRMHYDGSSFIVRNAGHSAGFDDENILKVY